MSASTSSARRFTWGLEVAGVVVAALVALLVQALSVAGRRDQGDTTFYWSQVGATFAIFWALISLGIYSASLIWGEY